MKLLLISLIIGCIFPQLPSKEFNSWNELQNDEIWVGYVQREDFPWCKASILLPYSMDEILLIIENVDDYKKILDSVIYSTKDKK